MTSPDFDAFVAPARRHPALWRLALGVVFGVVIYLVFVVGAVLGVSAVIGDGALSAFQTGDFLDQPVTTLILLFSFLGMALAALIVALMLHRRGLGSLIGPLDPALRDFGLTVLVVFATYLPAILLWTVAYEPQPNLAPRVWGSFLPLTILALLIQTGAEELVFRGYLLQQLAARFAWRLIWFWLPAIAFGLIHFDPSKGAAAWMLILPPMLFGVLAADLTCRRGNLGAAWGFHFTNNFVAIALISTKGTITGLALYLTPYSADELGGNAPLLVSDFALLILAWWILRRVLARYP